MKNEKIEVFYIYIFNHSNETRNMFSITDDCNGLKKHKCVSLPTKKQKIQNVNFDTVFTRTISGVIDINHYFVPIKLFRNFPFQLDGNDIIRNEYNYDMMCKLIEENHILPGKAATHQFISIDVMSEQETNWDII